MDRDETRDEGDAAETRSGEDGSRPSTVTVGVIGAGRRITPLLSRMLEYEYVDVRMVVDPDPAAPGVLIAQSLGVTTTTNPESLFKILDQIDFLFCVEDDPDLRLRTIEEFRRTNNTRTVLLNELATRFITSLSKDSRHLVELLPPGAIQRFVPGLEKD